MSALFTIYTDENDFHSSLLKNKGSQKSSNFYKTKTSGFKALNKNISKRSKGLSFRNEPSNNTTCSVASEKNCFLTNKEFEDHEAIKTCNNSKLIREGNNDSHLHSVFKKPRIMPKRSLANRQPEVLAGYEDVGKLIEKHTHDQFEDDLMFVRRVCELNDKNILLSESDEEYFNDDEVLSDENSYEFDYKILNKYDDCDFLSYQLQTLDLSDIFIPVLSAFEMNFEQEM